MPSHTQNGPREVSKSIKSPIFEACVYLVAKVKHAKDIGRIIKPHNEIAIISPLKRRSGETINNPIMPYPNELIPVTVIAGILGLLLKKTKLKPNVAEAPIPHTVPMKTLPWGAFRTFWPLNTEIPTPINAKNAVTHVEDVVFSLRIKIENIEAKIGEVARQNKINDTEVSATPYVKNIELNIWDKIITMPIGEKTFKKFCL